MALHLFWLIDGAAVDLVKMIIISIPFDLSAVIIAAGHHCFREGSNIWPCICFG
jgi:hypothetical protein